MGVSNESTKEKLTEAGKKLWEDEELRNKFFDDAGKFDASKSAKSIFNYVKTVVDLCTDVRAGFYVVEEPWKFYCSIAAAVYAVSPLDFVPDWFPIIGQSDDAVAIAAAVALTASMLNDYSKWKYGEQNATVFREEDFTNVEDAEFREVDNGTNSVLDGALDRLSNL